MYDVVIHTNLDLYQEAFPNKLPCIPRVGDEIESLTKHSTGFVLSLKVVSIRWRVCGRKYVPYYVPYIELHDKSSRSIQEFYEWYAPLVGKRVSSFI